MKFGSHRLKINLHRLPSLCTYAAHCSEQTAPHEITRSFSLYSTKHSSWKQLEKPQQTQKKHFQRQSCTEFVTVETTPELEKVQKLKVGAESCRFQCTVSRGHTHLSR